MKGLRHRSKLHPQVIRLERKLHGEEFGKFLCTSLYYWFEIGDASLVIQCRDGKIEVGVAVATLEARTRGKDGSEALPFNKTSLKE